jgi:hypothetical protein
MQEFQVTCINKPAQSRLHEDITHIGNSANRWRLSKQSIIWRIDNKREAFFAVDPKSGQKSYIGVVRQSGGKEPYIRAYANAQWNDALIALPECGNECEIKG